MDFHLLMYLEWKFGFGKSRKGHWDVRGMQDFLKQDSSCVNKVISGATPLLAALTDKKCPISVIKVLLRYGANVNVTDKYNRSPLTIALLHGAPKNVIELLLDAGCSLASCRLALHYAIAREASQKNVFHLLIERGADVNAVNADGYSVMCKALLQHVSASSIQMLYEAGVSLSSCTKHAHPLICATNKLSICGNLLSKDLVEWILLKAAPFITNDNVLTPLQSALKWCTYEADAINLLLQYFPDVNSVDESNNNLLHLALSNPFCCDTTVIKLLIKQGVCVDSANKYGETPLYRAAYNRTQCPLKVFELLIKNGATVNAQDKFGGTPLEEIVQYATARESYLLKLKVFLSAGAHIRFVERLLAKCTGRVFKILLQYILLQNPNLCIEGITTGHKDRTLSKYWKNCVFELKRMESITVGESCSLLKFLNSYFTPSYEAANCKPQVEKYDCDKLLRIKVNKEFPLYSGIISDKVDRCFMEAKLQEVQMYTVQCFPHQAGQKEVLLPYEVVCEIVQYLDDDDDLLSLIVAYTFMDRHGRNNSPEKQIGRKKRTSKESTEYRKKLRSCKL